MNAVLLESIHESAARALREQGIAARLERGALWGDALRVAVAGVEALGVRSRSTVDAGVFDAAPGLLAVGCFCIGTDGVDLAAAGRAGVPVFNAPFSNTRSVAELTIAEVIALHRRLADRSAALHRGAWEKSAAGSHEVRGRTLGIVGYGHIGSQVSVLAEALGMRVTYFDIVPRLPLGNARAARSLDELLAQADAVTLHVPESPATRGMIGAAQLARMRRGAVLINNARGSVVDLGALAAALRAGHLGGAALDVFPREPAGNDEAFTAPVQGLPNVILTPHVGGSTEEAQEAIAQDVAAKLARYLLHGVTTGAVNVPQVELPERAEERARSTGAGATGSARDAGAGGLGGGSGGSGGGGGGGGAVRLLHFHRNVPGVLSGLHAAIASRGGNITGEYLQTNRDIGYVVLDVEGSDAGAVEAAARGVPDTIRARVLT